ncbi:MAG: hypothetical protein MUF06_07180 [Pirellulaceae bacterium]|nr:hypothetical protein [Pirellulaceae bacterium]
MNRWWRMLCGAALLVLAPAANADQPRPVVIVALGASGTDEYAEQFAAWAARWEEVARRGGAEVHSIGRGEAGETTDRDRLHTAIKQASGTSPAAIWLVLIGHGTYDGKTARFNLRGPDIAPADLQEWLGESECPLAIINCTSSSGPFLAELSGPRRVVITATKSGHEYNFARFGDYLSAAIGDNAADLDKDEQTSLLEAYLLAGAKVREFYAAEARLETEHALLDDNGDKLGTPADWFRGVKPTKAAKDGASLDGALAAQFVLVRSGREEELSAEARTRRDELEQRLAALRPKRKDLPEDEYLALIEPVLAEIARLYLPAEATEKPEANPETKPQPSDSPPSGPPTAESANENTRVGM